MAFSQASRERGRAPDPAMAPILRRNLERNRAADVEVVESAVWVKTGSMPWWTGSMDGNRLVQRDSTLRGSTRVSTVDLRKFLNRDVDLLKLDIEEAEFEVIAHIRKELRRVKNILVEVHMINAASYAKLSEMLRVLALSVAVQPLGLVTVRMYVPALLTTGVAVLSATS